jgi:hyperosmotically inducible protein
MQRNRTHPVPTLALIALPFALALSAPLAIAHGTIDDQAKADASASEQPVADSWITTKVKADLLVTEETKGLDINVTTQNGVVTLAGRLDSQAQVEKAAAVARAIKGVKSVDTTTLTVKPKG